MFELQTSDKFMQYYIVYMFASKIQCFSFSLYFAPNVYSEVAGHIHNA